MSRLHVDWTRCDGHGLCADLLPEVVARDEWGYPVAVDPANPRLEVPGALLPHARRAVDACPLLALRILASPVPAPAAAGAGAVTTSGPRRGR